MRELLQKLLSVQRDYKTKNDELDQLIETHTKHSQAIQDLCQASDSFKELVKVFLAQRNQCQLNGNQTGRQTREFMGFVFNIFR